MKNIINKAFLLSLTALILTGCHVHTTKTIPDLPTKASVKIETGAAITFCDDTGSRCDTARMMTGSGSGVIISHHKNNTFSLTAGHVCDFGAERPPLPPLSSPQEIAAFAGSIGVHLDFVPSKMESSWLIFILDIDFNKSMLRWPEGARDSDGVWGPYWYEGVYESTGFKPYTKKEVNLDQKLADVYEKCKKHYDSFYKKRIKLKN